MHTEARLWRFVAFIAVGLLAFVLGRGATPAAEATSLLINASHVGTNEDGDVLWVYDFDGASRQWIVMKIDGEAGSIQVRTIDHPRDFSSY